MAFGEPLINDALRASLISGSLVVKLVLSSRTGLDLRQDQSLNMDLGTGFDLWPRSRLVPVNLAFRALHPMTPSGTMPVPQHPAVAGNVEEIFHGGPCLSPRDDML